MAAPQELSETDQLKTFKDFLLSYNRMSQICFDDCIQDFTQRALRNTEEKCALNCMEKYMRMNQRVSQRFHEFQMVANENMMSLAQKTGPTS